MANFNQTWHKVFLSKRDSSLFKKRFVPFSRGDNSKIVKIYFKFTKFKILFSRTSGPISTILDSKHPFVKRLNFWQIKDHLILKKRGYNDFFLFIKIDHGTIIAFHKCVLMSIDWNCFSGKRCGSLASCHKLEIHSDLLSYFVTGRVLFLIVDLCLKNMFLIFKVSNP